MPENPAEHLAQQVIYGRWANRNMLAIGASRTTARSVGVVRPVLAPERGRHGWFERASRTRSDPSCAISATVLGSSPELLPALRRGAGAAARTRDCRRGSLPPDTRRRRARSTRVGSCSGRRSRSRPRLPGDGEARSPSKTPPVRGPRSRVASGTASAAGGISRGCSRCNRVGRRLVHGRTGSRRPTTSCCSAAARIESDGWVHRGTYRRKLATRPRERGRRDWLDLPIRSVPAPS